MLKSIIISIVSILLSASVYAQESKYDQLHRFDADKFKERLKIYKSVEADMKKTNIESPFASMNTSKYSMRILDVQEQPLAKMPRMQITEDFHYTLEIKKYPQAFIPKKLEPILKNGIAPLKANPPVK